MGEMQPLPAVAAFAGQDQEICASQSPSFQPVAEGIVPAKNLGRDQLRRTRRPSTALWSTAESRGNERQCEWDA